MWKIVIMMLFMVSCAHLPITVDFSMNDAQVITSVTDKGIRVSVVHKGVAYECGYFKQGTLLSVKTTGGKVTVADVSCSVSTQSIPGHLPAE